MREVGAVVLVDCETQPTFEGADMITKAMEDEMSVGGHVKEREKPHKYGSLSRSIVSNASFRRRSRRSWLLADCEAIPPPPIFDPTRPS